MLFNPSHEYYKKDTFDNSSHLFVYKNDIVVHLPSKPSTVSEPVSDKLRGDITGFSEKSRRRAVFVAQNSVGIVSQFCCSYHHSPDDGELVKAHLNHFLTTLRQQFKGLKYFWFLEFQERGAPHYHVCTSIKENKENRLKLTNLWLSASSQERDIPCFNVHNHPKNFIKWDLNGSYVSKYLNKQTQKDVPVNYLKVGRFWGSSRGLAFCLSSTSIPPQLARLLKNYLLARLKIKGVKYRTFNNLKKCKTIIISISYNCLTKIFDLYGITPLVYNVNNI